MTETALRPNFITMADEKFIAPLEISVSQAARLYPDCLFYVYDVGLSDGSKKRLTQKYQNIRIKSWVLQYLPVQITYSQSFIGMKGIGLLLDYFSSLFGKSDYPRLKSLIKQSHIEIFFQNKLAIIKYHNDTVQQPFIFLDADAFLIQKIDELLDGSFDLGVTLRRKEERDDSFNNCRLLNVGVMLFLGNFERNKALIDEWYARARKTTELYSEQTSLTRLLLACNSNLLSNVNTREEIVLPGDHKIRVSVLDCQVYNFSWIEELNENGQLSHIKILHFKNERFKTKEFTKVADWLDIKRDS
jgi:hypothetical protein